jgi:hypothetical protein
VRLHEDREREGEEQETGKGEARTEPCRLIGVAGNQGEVDAGAEGAGDQDPEYGAPASRSSLSPDPNEAVEAVIVLAAGGASLEMREDAGEGPLRAPSCQL